MEIALIFLAILLIFGAKRIPEIARGLGKGIREFKDATTDIKRELTIDESRPQVRAPQHPGYAQGAQQPTYAPPPQGYAAPHQVPQGPPPPVQSAPSSLTQPAYPQGGSYAQPAPDGSVDAPPQGPPQQHG